MNIYKILLVILPTIFLKLAGIAYIVSEFGLASGKFIEKEKYFTYCQMIVPEETYHKLAKCPCCAGNTSDCDECDFDEVKSLKCDSYSDSYKIVEWINQMNIGHFYIGLSMIILEFILIPCEFVFYIFFYDGENNIIKKLDSAIAISLIYLELTFGVYYIILGDYDDCFSVNIPLFFMYDFAGLIYFVSIICSIYWLIMRISFKFIDDFFDGYLSNSYCSKTISSISPCAFCVFKCQHHLLRCCCKEIPRCQLLIWEFIFSIPSLITFAALLSHYKTAVNYILQLAGSLFLAFLWPRNSSKTG
ncbi:hypothetical protein SteCoe_6509 [Stentor coeruleus]|uniref:Uncharacterized protein n=1 Tax=Stentor coeruleus TaxID=5963 RepID=A0A1R2CPX0_9CILI|nr:hypothetical protein SteCoe_6509 [Stentor coeruleus]